jgi:hypothetical protein
MIFDNRQFLVKERVAMMKLTDTYDIYDPGSKQAVGHAREQPPVWSTLLRLFVNKNFLPTVINVYENEHEQPVLTLRKSPGVFRYKVAVIDGAGNVLGKLRSKVFSIGGGFLVDNAEGASYAEVKGDWKGWNFRMVAAGDGEELGVVTKQWAGLGKEFFTSADNYMISLSDSMGTDPSHSALLLAAGLAIDVVFKER